MSCKSQEWSCFVVCNTLRPGPDGRLRCAWSVSTQELLHYHDTEWGIPIHDDYRLFESLCLEGFQAGLSWRTILAKRDNFRAAFDGFNPDRIAHYDETDITCLLQNTGIIRHRGKITAVINNAQRMQALTREEGSLANYVWRYKPVADSTFTEQNGLLFPASLAMSNDLKRRGWRFIGLTIIDSFLQAAGVLNGHVFGCSSGCEDS